MTTDDTMVTCADCWRDRAMSPAEEAMRRVEALAEDFDKRAMYGGALVWTRLRAALTSPAAYTSPAEEAVRRVADELENEADRCSDIVARIALRDAANRVRDALASPAPPTAAGR